MIKLQIENDYVRSLLVLVLEPTGIGTHNNLRNQIIVIVIVVIENRNSFFLT